MTGVHAVYTAAKMMMPEADLCWLRTMKTRLYGAVPPKRERRPAITSLQLLKVGEELMDEIRPKIRSNLRHADALQYRDGLMIALTAFLPLRLKNLAAIDLVKHLDLSDGAGTLVIPRTETKTGVPIEFEIPTVIMPYLREYCESVRPRINRDSKCTALWASTKGGPLKNVRIELIFRRHSGRRPGFRICPHDARAAAATVWAVFSPEQIEVAHELLAHKDMRTTTTYYNRARGIQASRAYAKVLIRLFRSDQELR